MTKEEVIEQIKRYEDPNTKELWQNTGFNTADRYFGVKLSDLRDIAEKIGTDHSLSLALWSSGIYECKLLATMIEDPQKVTEEQLDVQISAIDTCDVVDKYCDNVASKTPYVNAKIDEWTAGENVLVRRAGYILLWIKAKEGTDFTDKDFEKYLATIQKKIKLENNWVKEAMNFALIGIGSKDRYLNEQAISIAEEVGKITVDYGQSSCKSIDARSILKSSRDISKIN